MRFIFSKLKIGIMGYCLTLKELVLYYWIILSTYLSDSWIDILYYPSKTVINDDEEYRIIEVKLGEVDVMSRFLVYMNYTEFHTIDDIKTLYPAWYESCDTLYIKFRKLESNEINEIEINLQARKDVLSGRIMNLGEILLIGEED